jgi:hypothetical protein
LIVVHVDYEKREGVTHEQKDKYADSSTVEGSMLLLVLDAERDIRAKEVKGQEVNAKCFFH